MDRRKFLQYLTRAALTMGLAGILPWKRHNAFGRAQEEMFDLSIVSGEAEQALNKAIDLLGGMGRVVKPGDIVVLKPNMGFPNPPVMASTTNPAVVKETARMCLEAGAKKVLILDHPLRRPEVCLKRNGIADAVKGLKNTHVFAVTDRKFFERVPVPDGKELHEVEILKDVITSDVLINIPIAKSHNATGVTFGMKGLMGVIYDRECFHEKVELNQAIADLSTVIKPDLTIIDATRIMTSGGPTGPGTVEQLNTVIAGFDPVAVDAAATSLAKWYGHSFDAGQVRHIKLAHEMGLGEINPDKVRVKRAGV